MMANQETAPISLAVERDLRLDLFRGIGLWMIFLDHIPDDVVAWLTLRNYGFSDAAEFFVFISGYLAGYIYGPIIRAGNFLAALKRLWTRVWQMYVAHIMLFLLFTAQIARTVRKFDNPMYEDEFNVHNFLQHPDVLIGQALTLRYKPVDLDVLPLYISLVATIPLMLWCMLRRPNWTLLGSVLLYIGARIFDWNFASYPPGTTLVLQSVRLAVDVRVRGMVRRRWHRPVQVPDPVARGADHGVCVDRLRIPDRDDLAHPVAGRDGAEMDDQGDLSDRQDRPRYAAFHALPRFGAGGLPIFPAQSGNPRNPNGCVRWSCAASIRFRCFASACSCPLARTGSWFSTPSGRVWAQLLVSVGGIATMTGLAWLLDRAEKVPNLFVDVAEFQTPKTAAEPGKA